MRNHPVRQNIVWTVLFSLFAILSLNACGDANNVTGPPAPVPLSPDAKLSSLTVNPGPLPTFSSDVVSYTVNVATAVASVTVTAQPQNAGATVRINSQLTKTGLSVTLGTPGSNTLILIVVTAVSGSQNTYSVTVNRAPPGGDNNLSALSVTGQTLTPAFNASTLNYTVNVATTTASVAVTARKSDPNAVLSGSVTAGTGQATGQATIPLNGPGTGTSVSITVTAPNGNQKIYTITMSRAAPSGNNNLSALVVSAGALIEPFDAGTMNYTVIAPSATTDTTVTATVADSIATLTINNSPATSGAPSVSIPLAPGAMTLIPIVVTAGDGTPKTYTVNITVP